MCSSRRNVCRVCGSIDSGAPDVLFGWNSMATVCTTRPASRETHKSTEYGFEPAGVDVEGPEVLIAADVKMLAARGAPARVPDVPYRYGT